MKATAEARDYSILIADDDRASLDTLRAIIQPEGYQTLLASSGEEAIDIVRGHPGADLQRHPQAGQQGPAVVHRPESAQPVLRPELSRPAVFPPRRPHGMKVVPLNDKVLVKRLEAEEKTAGGIVLPDTAREKPRQGKVLAVGEGKRLDDGRRAPFQVKVNDRVLFTSYAGNEITVDGEEYLLMSEDDILGVVS